MNAEEHAGLDLVEFLPGEVRFVADGELRLRRAFRRNGLRWPAPFNAQEFAAGYRELNAMIAGGALDAMVAEERAMPFAARRVLRDLLRRIRGG